MQIKAQTKISIIISLCCLLGLAMILSLVVGSAALPPITVLKIICKPLPILGLLVGKVDPMATQIIWQLRMPRICLAIFVGMALACAGTIFQSLFRNPLADTYVTGASSGAGFGATLAFTLFSGLKLFAENTIPFLAFLGALGTVFLVYQLASVKGRVAIPMLLLAGIATTSLLNSLNSLLMIFYRQEIAQIMLWMMGGFNASRWDQVWLILPYLALGLIIAFFSIKELDLILMGTEKAAQLGVNLKRLQKMLIFAASLLVAAAVSVSGLIPFVGLIVPHIIRLIFGPSHKYLLPVATLNGGIFLLLADTLARTVLSPLELPVGIVTAFLGAPFFIYLLRQSKLKNF